MVGTKLPRNPYQQFIQVGSFAVPFKGKLGFDTYLGRQLGIGK